MFRPGKPVTRRAVKTVALCVLSAALSMATHGGFSDALGASGPLLPPAPVLPSSAANPPSPDIPVGETVLDVPAGNPQYRNPTPMPAPAATDHYAVPAGSSTGDARLAALPWNRRFIAFLTTA